MARRDWVGAGVYVDYKLDSLDGIVSTFYFTDHNGKKHIWSPQQSDLNATDWHIVP